MVEASKDNTSIKDVMKREEVLTKWITDNMELPMLEIVKKLDGDTSLSQEERYNIMWTFGVMAGKETAIAKIVNALYNVVSDTSPTK